MVADVLHSNRKKHSAKKGSVKKVKKISAKKTTQKGGVDLNKLLRYSSKKGDFESVKRLVELGANIHTEYDQPLVLSSKNGHSEIVKFLVENGANIHAQDDEALVLSSENGHLEIVKFLVENGANIHAQDDAALRLSSEDGHFEVENFLLTNATNLTRVVADIRNRQARRQDTTSNVNLNKELITSSENGDNLENIRRLIQKGADVNTKDENGETPLLWANVYGKLDVVKFLVESGANVNAKNNKGNTPLMSSSRHGHLEVVKYLVSKGADVNAKDTSGHTALWWSIEEYRDEIEEFLSRQLAKVSTSVEEDSSDFVSIQSSTESISNKEIKCTNVDIINMENYDTNSQDVFTIFYLNNLNKFSSNSCVSKNEMKEYLKSEREEDPSLLTTIWKGGDKSGVGGKPTLKFIIKLPPNNVWITLGSFDRIMNSSIKKWYLLPLFGDKKRRIGYKYGASANHGQIPGSKIYKVFTKEEIISGIICKESDSDYPLYFKDFTIQDLSDGINSNVIIKTIKNHFI